MVKGFVSLLGDNHPRDGALSHRRDEGTGRPPLDPSTGLRVSGPSPRMDSGSADHGVRLQAGHGLLLPPAGRIFDKYYERFLLGPADKWGVGGVGRSSSSAWIVTTWAHPPPSSTSRASRCQSADLQDGHELGPARAVDSRSESGMTGVGGETITWYCSYADSPSRSYFESLSTSGPSWGWLHAVGGLTVDSKAGMTGGRVGRERKGVGG